MSAPITARQLRGLKRPHDYDCGVGSFKCSCPQGDRDDLIDRAADAIKALEAKVTRLTPDECGEDHVVGERPDECFACLAQLNDNLRAEVARLTAQVLEFQPLAGKLKSEVDTLTAQLAQMKESNCCKAQQDGHGDYECTLFRGHFGTHIATGNHGQVFKTWDAEPTP